MLVTLAVVALVAAVLAQALVQLARVEQLLEGGRLRSVAEALRVEWVRSALEALVPATNSDEVLSGSEREFSGWSSAVPLLPEPGMAQLRLRLVTADDGSLTELLLLPGADAPTRPALSLLSWPGRQGHFRYLDEQGQWQDRWPALNTQNIVARPQAGAAPPMPRLIALVTGLPAQSLVFAAPRASPQPLPTKRQLEAQ